MGNSIYERQNEDSLLRCLIAQRNEYTQAKKISQTKSIMALVYIAFLLVTPIVDCELMIALVFLFSVSLVVINKHVDSCIRFHKRHAASIQQYVDVELFSNALRSNKSEWGELPSQTDLAETLSDFANDDTSSVTNWYSDYSSLPNELQVFYCQHENTRWSYKLYKSFLRFQNIVCGLGILVIFISVFLINPRIISFICFLSWISPVIDFTYTINKEISGSTTQFEKLNLLCDRIEKKIKDNTSISIKNDLIVLQYKIKECRETCYLIPDWFYNKSKSKYQDSEDSIAMNLTIQMKS